MTHDELVTVLNNYDTGLSNGMMHKDLVFASAKALRVVVELHKPIYAKVLGEVCEQCSTPVQSIYSLYPCPTIQAIEKELS